MTETQIISRDLDSQLRTVIKLSQSGNVVWLVTNNELKKQLEDVLDNYKLIGKIYISSSPREDLKVPEDIDFVIHQGMTIKRYVMPSEATVLRIVPDIDDERVTRFNKAMVYYVQGSDSLSESYISRAPEIKDSANTLTVEQKRVIQKLQGNDIPLGILMISLIAYWEEEIFASTQSFLESEQNYGKYYKFSVQTQSESPSSTQMKGWITEDDIDSVANLAELMYLNHRELGRWAHDNKLSPRKLQEVWDLFMSLSSTHGSGILLPQVGAGSAGGSSPSSPNWRQGNRDNVRKIIGDVYSENKVKLGGATRVSRSVLHSSHSSNMMGEIISIVSEIGDAGEDVIQIYIHLKDSQSPPFIPTVVSLPEYEYRSDFFTPSAASAISAALTSGSNGS